MLILDALRSTVLASVIFGLIRPQKNKSAGRMIVVYWLVWA